MIIGNDRRENYNFSNGQEVNHKTCNEGKKHEKKGVISPSSQVDLHTGPESVCININIFAVNTKIYLKCLSKFVVNLCVEASATECLHLPFLNFGTSRNCNQLIKSDKKLVIFWPFFDQ